MISYEDCVQRGREIVVAQSSMNWELGDLARKVVNVYKNDFSGSLEIPEILEKWARDIGCDASIGHIMNLRKVSQKWPKSRRISGVSWTVHRVLAYQDNRFDIIKPGMTKVDAEALVGRTIAHSRVALTVADGIRRLQSAEGWIKSAARVDYSNASEDELQLIGECLSRIEDAENEFLVAAEMQRELYVS
jgi:hypothetical protein